MKYHQLLTEDARLTTELFRFANRCAIRLHQDYKFKKQFNMPTVEIDMAEIDTDINLIHDAVKYNKITYAAFDENFFGIALQNNDIGINSNKIEITDIKGLSSAIMHEVRHILDDYLSDSKSFTNYPNLDVPEEQKTKQLYKQYYKHHLEVSARVEQALMYLMYNSESFMSKEGIDNTAFISAMNSAATKNNLTVDVVGNKIYKTFARRASQLATHLYSEYKKFLSKNIS